MSQLCSSGKTSGIAGVAGGACALIIGNVVLSRTLFCAGGLFCFNSITDYIDAGIIKNDAESFDLATEYRIAETSKNTDTMHAFIALRLDHKITSSLPAAAGGSSMSTISNSSISAATF